VVLFEFDQYLANKLGNQLHLPPSDRAAVLSGKEKANLIDLLWKFEATEQIRNRLAAYFEFLPEFRLASSKIGIARSFDVDKVVFGRVKGDDIKLALVPTPQASTNLHVASNEIALELVPFGYKLFEMVAARHTENIISSSL